LFVEKILTTNDCIPFQDIESASDLRIDLDAKFSSLKNELDFVSKTQEEVHFRQLKSEIHAIKIM